MAKPQRKMSPEALERLRKYRSAQRVGARNRRRNRIRARHSISLRPGSIREVTGPAPVASLNCGICDRPLRRFHRESGMCKRCFDLDTRDVAITIANLYRAPASGDLLCEVFDNQEG